jgi:hypothetical protein
MDPVSPGIDRQAALTNFIRACRGELMHRLFAGCCSLICVFLLASSASAQRIPAPIGISAQSSGIASRAAAHRAAARLDKPPQPVVIGMKFIEVSGEFRTFPNWADVSGNDPSVVTNDTRSWAGGINVNGGIQLGSLPIWAQVGGYYSTGLETNTTLEDGETIHGKINSYGAGAGVRLSPIHTLEFALYLWSMGYYDWNDGDFAIENEETRTENRIHRSWTGDYGVGAIFRIDEVMGINFGISYNGMFDKKNADENFRIKLGLILNAPRDMIY